MTDVVEIARQRQARLAAEIGKLDNFIRMAEALLKQSRLESNVTSGTEDEKSAELTSPATARPDSEAAGTNGADGAKAKT